MFCTPRATPLCEPHAAVLWKGPGTRATGICRHQATPPADCCHLPRRSTSHPVRRYRSLAGKQNKYQKEKITGTAAETRAVRSVLNSRLCIAKKGNDCANYRKKEARASFVTLVPPASVSCLRPHPGCHQRRGLERLRVVGAGETAPASAAPDSSVGRRGRTQHRRTDKTRGHP